MVDDEADLDAVVAAAVHGDPRAFERLYTELAPVVAGYLRTQGASDADDLTSEVFLGVFRGLARFAGGWSAFRSWTFTIAHRRLTDARRHAGRSPRSVLLQDDHEADVDLTGEVLRRLATERVARVCGQLVPDQRDVMLLRLVAGLTVEEIARTLGKTPGAVKQLQRRALAALARILDEEGVPL